MWMSVMESLEVLEVLEVVEWVVWGLEVAWRMSWGDGVEALD